MGAPPVVLVWRTWENEKPCSVNAASWFPSVKSSPTCPAQALIPSRSTQHHFTLADQVHQLVTASETTPDLGFMARLLALCSLPRSNPGNRLQYKRVNGPFTLYMTVTGGNKLPFGNLPRLILAWICTEAVRTALLHDSTAARVGALFQLLVQDTTAQDFGLPSSAIRLRM